jgi:hypothetical protein
VLRRLGRGFLWSIPGYLVGAFVGYWLVVGLSSNAHDKSVEASMTSAFIIAPLCGLIAFIAGVSRAPRPTT